MSFISEIINQKPSIINHTQPVINEIPVNILDTRRICNESSWNFQTSLEDGLKYLLTRYIIEQK